MDGDGPILIDGMKLAYEAFQGCRHLCKGTEALLEMILRVLPRVEEQDALVVDVPASWAIHLDLRELEEIRPNPEADPRRLWTMPDGGPDRSGPMNRPLLPAIAVGARELLRLWSVGAKPAIRALGYALHRLPDLVRPGERFDPEAFGFCFRIAASSWAELSPEMRDTLCALAEIEPREAQRRVSQEGFTIDMFGGGRAGRRDE